MFLYNVTVNKELPDKRQQQRLLLKLLSWILKVVAMVGQVI